RLTDFQLSGLSRFFFVEDKVANIPALISRTGYTGEDGFELYFVADKAPEVWNKLLESGEIYGIKPCGLGARDTLRLESSYSLYGSDIDDSATPLEAGLGWQVRFKKQDFIGKTALSKQKEQGIKRQIICFELDVRAVPRHHHKIMKHDAEIGHVTSGTFSPTFKKGLGMGYVKTEYSEIGTKLDIMIRDRKYPATVVKRPFYEFRQLEKGN
ncbi:MAG: glycine cleavage system aminomethyltransferase GcvT, partial [Nanoarchaeota archaeon]|nr:glycine cleavage system aminomethyltransferase GcvT [Nanoarchaeota archaeon]